MASVEDGLQAQIRNIEATYGKTMPEWFVFTHRVRLSAVSEVDRELIGWLRAAYGQAG
jgi:hypothetical protein